MFRTENGPRRGEELQNKLAPTKCGSAAAVPGPTTAGDMPKLGAEAKLGPHGACSALHNLEKFCPLGELRSPGIVWE